jgi:signal transduction histidine kinase
MNLRSKELDPYGPNVVALAEQTGAQIAGAIASSRVYEAARKEADVRAALARISLAASRALELGVALNAVADEVATMVQFDRMTVVLKQPESGKLAVAFVRGVALPHKAVGSEVQPEPERPWHSYVEIEPDLSLRPDRDLLEPLGLNSRLQVPLGVEGAEPLGFLGIWSKQKGAYVPAHADLLLRVAAQITPAIQNALVHRRTVELARAREEAARLEAQARELERTNEAKSQFLSTVSHELRTPLTSIVAFTDLLARDREQSLNEKQRRHLDIVRRNARQLGALINDLLDISRIESGKLRVVKAQFDLTELVRHVVDSLAPVMASMGQRLIMDLPGELRITGDRDRILQVVSNLISNASKYSPNGSTVALVAYADGEYVALAVRDQGVGISRADQSNLFTPFFRADNSTTRAVGGTGLGLAIAKRLVELHGGDISVVSEPGKGSTFTVRLPRTMDEAEAAAA